MFQPTENHTDVGLGLLGTIATALSHYFGASVISYVTGILTAIYMTLKIIGWFLDRFGKKKSSDKDKSLEEDTTEW